MQVKKKKGAFGGGGGDYKTSSVILLLDKYFTKTNKSRKMRWGFG